MIDWSQAPEWARYAAMDEDEIWYFYENMPQHDTPKNLSHWIGVGRCVIAVDPRPPWKDSLQKRPEE